MKKLLLLFILFFSTSVLFAQGLNQPSVFNNQCDTNNDGIETFNLLEISSEILAGLNSNDYVVTHHLTQADATNGINPLSGTYTNIANPQLIFARVVNTITSQVEIITYNLNVNPTPIANSMTMTACNQSGVDACFDLQSIYLDITLGNPSLFVTFYVTNNDAVVGANPISNINSFCAFASPQTIYYRNQDMSTGCYSIGTIVLETLYCQQTGYPQSITQCVDNNDPACFDLTSNDNNVLGPLNPSDYTISYHISQADAQNDINALASPYCIAIGTQQIFSRLENNTTQGFQIFNFVITSHAVSYMTGTLASMDQCDDNNDAAVIFNLNDIGAQMNSSNPLVFFTNFGDAWNGVNAIINPVAFSVSAQSTITNIFVREIIANSCDSLYTFQVRAFANCNLASSCGLANSLCNALGVPFANSQNITINEVGASYGCLGSHPNPTWFFLPVSQAGNINLQIAQVGIAGQPIDVDYIVYGPFANPVTPCSGQLTTNMIVSCSYSANAIEYPIIPNAQPGQFYLIMTTNFSNQPGFITITETAGTQGAINCSGIRLNAFLDSNSNGNQDGGEQNFPLGEFHYELNNNGNVHNITSPVGVYNIYDLNAANSYDVSYSIDPSYAASYGISTSSYNNISVVLGAGMQTYNFPITVTQTYNDLAVTIIPLGQPRPGFTYENKIVYANLGNQIIASGTLTFNNDALVTITGNTQTGTTPTASGFTYNFTNLMPFEVRMMTVTMQVPTIPTVTIGNYLTNNASITPLAGDVVPANNSSIATQEIIGAYDPNDKMESHGEQILFSSFSSNDYLYYTIRFENTGNASAINVRVNDVLDAQLDENSVKIINASHAYVMDRVANNLTWRFDNIQLPAVSQNPAGGKGYVMFKVKLKPGFAVGDIIPNTASIYFDYNPAIITNTFNTEFVSQLAVDEFENGNFVFYPNPVNDIVTISLKNNANAISSIVVYDVIGKVIMTKKPANTMATETVDLSAATSGIYFLEVTTDNNLKVVKKLLVN